MIRLLRCIGLACGRAQQQWATSGQRGPSRAAQRRGAEALLADDGVAVTAHQWLPPAQHHLTRSVHAPRRCG